MRTLFRMPFSEDWFRNSTRWQYPVKSLVVFSLSRKVQFRHEFAVPRTIVFTLVWLSGPSDEDRNWFYLENESPTKLATLRSVAPLYEPIVTKVVEMGN